MTRQVVIAGGTGEVGKHLLARLAGQPDLEVRALVRRPGTVAPAPGLREVVFDYEAPESYTALFAEPCDFLFIALGTTRRKAGSDEAFLRVDRDYPLRLISAMAMTNTGGRVGLVSSVGADKPRGLYLTAKAEVEAALEESGLAHAIARPSMLRSRRAEFRPLEVVFDVLFAPGILALGRWLFPRSRGWWRWAPVQVREVATALFQATLGLGPREHRVLEGPDLHQGPVSHWGRP
ncbi:MAG TPA: NAD(P)H-binding protein [Geothrix sp.]|nr:NAD(P)H-binding protein [Geothrix sp.]